MSENASPCVQFPDRVLHHYCRGVPPDHPHACGADLVGGAQVRFLGSGQSKVPAGLAKS